DREPGSDRRSEHVDLSIVGLRPPVRAGWTATEGEVEQRGGLVVVRGRVTAFGIRERPPVGGPTLRAAGVEGDVSLLARIRGAIGELRHYRHQGRIDGCCRAATGGAAS